MDSDLVCASGFQNTFYIGEIMKSLQDTVVRDRALAVAFIYRHFFSLRGMSAYGLVHGALILLQNAVADGGITSCDGMLLQLRRNAAVCRIVFAGNDGACGIPVDPMYDARPQNAVDPRKLAAAVIHQGIDQCAAVMACRRVHHHPLWFVYDNHVLVLIQDIKGDILRFNVGLLRRRKLKRHHILRLDPVASLYGCTVYGNAVLLYHSLDIGARQRIDKRRQTLIDSLVFQFFSYFKAKHIHWQ